MLVCTDTRRVGATAVHDVVRPIPNLVRVSIEFRLVLRSHFFQLGDAGMNGSLIVRYITSDIAGFIHHRI